MAKREDRRGGGVNPSHFSQGADHKEYLPPENEIQ
jgi:hypothetical protein